MLFTLRRRGQDRIAPSPAILDRRGVAQSLLSELAEDHHAGAAVLFDSEAQGAAEGEAQDAALTKLFLGLRCAVVSSIKLGHFSQRDLHCVDVVILPRGL